MLNPEDQGWKRPLGSLRCPLACPICCFLSSAHLSSYQDLEVKSLLLEAYVKGQQELLYVVPFVAKVLESSLRSMVSTNVIN